MRDKSDGHALSRRTFIKSGITFSAGTIAAPALLSGTAWGQSKEIYAGIWAGAQGEFIRKSIVPKFESDYQCKVYLEEGNTLEQVAKLRAQRENPRFTVMFVDDFAVDLLKQEKLIDQIDSAKLSNLKNVDPRYVLSDSFGVGVAASIAAMFYNPKISKRPESYAALWLPENKANITLSSIKTTSGMYFVIAAAALATGKSLQEAQYLSDEGFRKIADLKPNISNQFTAPSQAASMVAQGETGLGGLAYSKWVYPYTRKGAAVDMAYASEGSFSGINCQVLVKNAPNQDLGIAFMNRILDASVQKALAEETLSAPTVSGITLAPEILKYVPYPSSELEKRGVTTPDFAYLNKVRSDWLDKWNRALS